MIFPDDVAIATPFCAYSREQRAFPDDVASAVICVVAPLSSTSPDEVAQIETFLARTEAFISADEVAFAVNREHLKEPCTLADDEASIPTSSRSIRLTITLALELTLINNLSPLAKVGLTYRLAAERHSIRVSFSFFGSVTFTFRLL